MTPAADIRNVLVKCLGVYPTSTKYFRSKRNGASVRHIPNLLVLTVVGLFVAATESFAQPIQLAGVACTTPPLMHCPSSNCPRETILDTGPLVAS